MDGWSEVCVFSNVRRTHVRIGTLVGTVACWWQGACHKTKGLRTSGICRRGTPLWSLQFSLFFFREERGDDPGATGDKDFPGEKKFERLAEILCLLSSNEPVKVAGRTDFGLPPSQAAHVDILAP